MVPTLAVLSGVLLGLYALGVVYALCAPARQPDPQRGVAVGCLGLVLAGLAGAAAVLALAVCCHLTVLIYLIAAGCVYPPVLLAGNVLRRLVSLLVSRRHMPTAPAGPREAGRRPWR